MRYVKALLFIFFMLHPSICLYAVEKAEVRGVWLRPPKDISELTQILDDITSAGFNSLFVETFYHGFSIYPSSTVPSRPEYGNNDVLGLIINEAHKRGLQVHAWTEVFYWQVDTEKYPEYPETSLFKGHSDWKLLLRDGKHTGYSENAHIFANPSHPGVRSLLLDFYRELITSYELDGLNLDYVRYPSGEMDAGYDEYSRKEYMNVAGVDPINIDKKRDPKAWQKWVEWREDQVTEFVQQVATMVREAKPSIWLSAAIFGDYYAKRYSDFHFQDWASWTEKGMIDIVMPMAYGATLDSIESSIKQVQQRAGNEVIVMPALAISTLGTDGYTGSAHPPMKEQIALIRRLNTMGHSIFCYQWIKNSGEGFSSFSEGAYSVRASAPKKTKLDF